MFQSSVQGTLQYNISLHYFHLSLEAQTIILENKKKLFKKLIFSGCILYHEYIFMHPDPALKYI